MWKNIIRKQERDMEVGSTNYAKDLGDSVKFGGYVDESKNVTIPKSQLGEVLDKYEQATGKKINRLTEITMSDGPTTKFVLWAKQNLGM